MGLQEAGGLDEEEHLALGDLGEAACLLKEAVGQEEVWGLQEGLVLGEVNKWNDWKEVEGQEAGYQEEKESLR